MRIAIFLIFIALMSVSCLRDTEFRCLNDAQCGADGNCESIGYCSVPDEACPSGRSFSVSAGALARKCTAYSADAGPSTAEQSDGLRSDHRL